MKNLQVVLMGALLSVGSVWAGENCSLSLAGAWKATRPVKFTALSAHVGPWSHLAEFGVVE